MAESNEDESNLTEIYKSISKNYSEVENTMEASNSDNVQSLIAAGIKLCSQAIQMINEISIFSENEDIEELSTESIKFMVLPAFAGYFECRVLSKERQKHLQSSKDYFSNFLKLSSNYSVVQDEGEIRTDASSVREQKIRALRNKKKLEQRIEELQQYVEKDHVDEEIKREFYLSQVKRWIHIASEEIQSANQELEILNMMAARGNQLCLQPKDQTNPIPFRPLLLTRTKAQAKVFGAGYPSLPTYSVEEFFEMQSSQQQLGNRHESNPGELSESKEEKEEADDPDYIREQRKWDEFKDDNRRGDGNRKNRG